jgi:GxxExxY protein
MDAALNSITGAVVTAGVRIHQKLGPGLLESVYDAILARDLERMGYRVERQKIVNFMFEGTLFEDAFRPDLIINECVVVEIKSARAVDPVFERQLLTYLRILDLRVGLLMNFGMVTMKAGIRRIAN